MTKWNGGNAHENMKCMMIDGFRNLVLKPLNTSSSGISVTPKWRCVASHTVVCGVAFRAGNMERISSKIKLKASRPHKVIWRLSQ